MWRNLKDKLNDIYTLYNKKAYVDPDPLLFLYDYPDKQDREIAGLIAACFAYGRVQQIMKTLNIIFGKLNPSPYTYVMTRKKKEMAKDFEGFRYRFASEKHLVNLLWGIRGVIKKFLSLENCFYERWAETDETVLPGLVFLSDQIRTDKEIGHLLADPRKKSACKRSLLFLRWMVRRDEVDPGGWEKIQPSQLVVPLDTHMYKTGLMLGFTKRKHPDLMAAWEITLGFKRILEEDPVRYDFCLTRFGIRNGMSMDQLQEVVST